MRIRINQSTIEILQGDITEQETDAVVNAANDHLWMGAGVAGAIKKKGGDVIEEEAMRQGPVPVGEAVITTGGALKAGHVIHAAAMGQDLKTDESKVRAATRNSLLRMAENDLSSIALPALGTGVGGLSIWTSAQGMIDEVLTFLQARQAANRVVFVLFDQEAFDAFNGELDKRFSAQ